MRNNPLPRLDASPEVKARLLPYCRLRPGEIWQDKISGHRVGCFDAADDKAIQALMNGARARLAVHDPPYNLTAFKVQPASDFIDWCDQWVSLTYDVLSSDAALYVWLGADQNNGFQPLPDFMMMMREKPFKPRSFITMRNQRGYGTQKTGWQFDRNCSITRKARRRFMSNTPTSPRFSKDIIKQSMGK